MSADDPCGTIQLELDSLRLCILGPKQEELRVRVDFELVSPEDISKGEKEPEETDATTLSRDHFSVLKWSDGTIQHAPPSSFGFGSERR